MKLANSLFWALIFLYPLGQLEQLPLGLGWGRVYLHDLILAALWVIMLTKYRRRWLTLIKKDRLGRAFLAFSAWAGLTWALNYSHFGRQNFIGLAYLARWLLLAAPYFFLKMTNDQWSNDQIKRMLLLSLFLTAFLGLIQYLLFPDLRHLRYFGWDDHYYRLTGTFLDPNFIGLILVLDLGLELTNRSALSFRILFYLALLYLTYSRASWLALLALLVAWGLKKKTWHLGAIFVISYLFLIAFSPKPFGEGGNLLRTFSIKSRWHNWEESWQLIKQNPVLGVGFNNYQLVQPEHHKADNSFLLVWATTGPIGLMLFLRLLFHWRPLWLMAPIFFHGFFNNSLFYPWVLLLVWSFLGLR